MRSAKKVLAVVLTALMLALCLVPAFAEDTYEYTPETCPGHTLTVVVIDPTCAESGYTQKTCTRCGYTLKTNYVSPTGAHDWQVNTETERAATCGQPGFKQERCSVCGNTRTTNTPATGNHTWELTGTRPATCAVNGENYYTCSVCGADKAENIPATGAHVDANKDNVCDNCGQSVRAEGPSSGMTFMNVWDRFFGFFWNLIQKFIGLFN